MASRGPLLLGTLWLTAAVTATSVGLLAVHLVGNEVGGQVAPPLDDEGVQQALVSVSPTPSHAEEPETEHATEQPAAGRARTVVTDGGVVSAGCSAGRPRLLYATPAEGFRTERGTWTVTFVGARRRVVLSMSCVGDQLHTTTATHRTGTAPATQAPTPSPVVQPTQPERPEPSDSSDSPDGHPELESETADGN